MKLVSLRYARALEPKNKNIINKNSLEKILKNKPIPPKLPRSLRPNKDAGQECV